LNLAKGFLGWLVPKVVCVIILETAVQDDKVMQEFDLESLPRGVIIPKR